MAPATTSSLTTRSSHLPMSRTTINFAKSIQQAAAVKKHRSIAAKGARLLNTREPGPVTLAPKWRTVEGVALLGAECEIAALKKHIAGSGAALSILEEAVKKQLVTAHNSAKHWQTVAFQQTFAARLSIMEPGSRVIIERLRLPHPVLAFNVWGVAKPQPATLSLTVDLGPQFSDDEGADNLANSVNYGELSKRILSLKELALANPADVLGLVTNVVIDMGRRLDNPNIIRTINVELHLPKASMTGEAHVFRSVAALKADGTWQPRKFVSIPNMNLMVLIGINDYERQAKQPVVATLKLDCSNPGVKVFTEEAMGALEQALVEAIEESSFETLEALVHFAAKQVGDAYTAMGFGSATVNLRLEKPKAIAFAHAAVVEHTIAARRQ